MLPLLATLSPDAAILLLALGWMLIAVELNRPGSILPGGAGLLLMLLAAASLFSHHPRPVVAAAVIACFALLVAQVRWHLRWLIAAIATIFLILSMRTLLPPIPGPEIGTWVAICGGFLIGAGTTVLTRIAQRARQNKGLD